MDTVKSDDTNARFSMKIISRLRFVQSCPRAKAKSSVLFSIQSRKDVPVKETSSSLLLILHLFAIAVVRQFVARSGVVTAMRINSPC